MIVPYAPDGKYSRAWWLYWFKKVGDQPTLQQVRAMHSDAAKLKIYRDDLIAAGYLSVEGKLGRGGGGATIHLTSLGHRYLNEHQEELRPHEPELGRAQVETDAVKAGKTHSVPEAPGDTPLTHIPKPDPNAKVQLHQPELIRVPPTPKPEKPKPPRQSKQKTFRQELEQPTIDVMLEKFGDQVTVKDLFTHMEGDK